jgi:hypothetical protein
VLPLLNAADVQLLLRWAANWRPASNAAAQVSQWLPDVWKSRQLSENKSVQVQAAV